MLNLMTLEQNQWMTMAFDIYVGACTHLSYQHDIIDYNSFWKRTIGPVIKF